MDAAAVCVNLLKVEGDSSDELYHQVCVSVSDVIFVTLSTHTRTPVCGQCDEAQSRLRSVSQQYVSLTVTHRGSYGMPLMVEPLVMKFVDGQKYGVNGNIKAGRDDCSVGAFTHSLCAGYSSVGASGCRARCRRHQGRPHHRRLRVSQRSESFMLASHLTDTSTDAQQQ